MTSSILVYGFGNIGRQDDGLGVLCAERLEKELGDAVNVEVNFQLNAEDALTVSEHSLVVFVDASTATDEAYAMEELKPDEAIAFSTHAMSPQAILSFSQEMYKSLPEAHLLHIKGYEWEFGLPLTSQAEKNLVDATSYIKQWLTKRMIH